MEELHMASRSTMLESRQQRAHSEKSVCVSSGLLSGASVQVLPSSAMPTSLTEAIEQRPAIQMKDVDTENTCRPQDENPQEMSMASITLLTNTNTESSAPKDDRGASLWAWKLLERETESITSQETVKLEETILRTHIPSCSNRSEDIGMHTIQLMKGRLSQETTTQISSLIDGGEHSVEDMEQASHTRNMGSQEMCAQTSSSSQTASGVHSFQRPAMVELSLNQHSGQDDAAKEEAAMRSFIMHRFLPAAKEVAAEHESCIASQASKSPSGVSHSLLPERTPFARRLRSRSRHAPKGFTPPHLLNSWHHQEDNIPQSMRSCGFLCLGLKTALFRARRAVSVSKPKKKTWPIHSSDNTRVADEGISVIASEMEGLITKKKEALGAMTSSPNSTSALESPPRHAVEYDASFYRTGRPSSDGFRCDPPSSHSEKAKKAENHHGNRKPKQSCQGNHLTARDEQGLGAGMVEEAVTESKASSGDCMCTWKTNGNKLASVSAPNTALHDGSGDDDDETQFFDAMSRLNSVKSSASFYTFGSPRSECEGLAFQGEWINDAVEFIDAPNQSVNLTSEDKSVPMDVDSINGKGPSARKTSSLSQRVGNALKLDIHRKTEISPSNEDSCVSDPKNEHQPAKLQTETFSRQWHGSLDSMGSLNTSTVATISPVFPAKCQNTIHNTLGWPFGISTYQASRGPGSPCQARHDQSIDKYVMGGQVPSPPLPPSPTGSWLGKALTKNASKTSPLATLQQKEKRASARKKLDFISENQEAARRWEDVVRGSRMHLERLRFSEELHEHRASNHHPSNLNVDKPLKL